MSKKLVSRFLALLLMLCAGLSSAALAEGTTITVTDMFGREVSIAGPVTRVIATEPGDCEILYALGCGDALVGRGLYCDYPAEATALPAVHSGADTNIEEILALNPQVVIMNDMAHSVEQVQMLESCGIAVVTTNADSIPEVYENIRLLGAIMGREAEAEALIADMKATFDAVAGVSPYTGKTVYFEVMPLEWGLWTAGRGTFMDELAAICGLENAFADVEGWQPISEEQVIARDPDYIVLVTGMGETAADEVASRTGWEGMKAIENGAIYNADSYAMTRPGPRLTEAVVALYEFLNGAAQ